MVWVINSNSNTCKIYDYHKPTSKLKLIKEIQHPELRGKISDLVSDKPGKYATNESAHGAYAPSNNPKDNMIDSFLHEVASLINNERSKNTFSKLIIIAPPHVEGILKQHMDKNSIGTVICNIQKDLLHLKDNDLLKILDDTPNY